MIFVRRNLNATLGASIVRSGDLASEQESTELSDTFPARSEQELQ